MQISFVWMRIFSFCCLVIAGGSAWCQNNTIDTKAGKIDAVIRDLMETGDIPGLSVVIVQNEKQVIRNYGYADLANKTPVTDSTLFELGSCSKAFTALGVISLVQKGHLRYDGSICDYLPWLTLYYKNKRQCVTVEQLLHHTSGIPWTTISKIPESSAPNALEETVFQLVDQQLIHKPGSRYEYATINYDILALLIQKVTHEPFEDYMAKAVLAPLALNNTTIGYAKREANKAVGYKIGFSIPMPYSAPAFRGNNAAGYFISNPGDVATWLKFQVGLFPSELFSAALTTHQRDETVPLHDMAAYAMGWEVSLNGSNQIYHSGLNPNYSTHISFRPRTKTGVAVLANANSQYTSYINDVIMHLICDEEVGEFHNGDFYDQAFSAVCLILLGYVVVVFSYMGYILWGASKGNRPFAKPVTVRYRLVLLFCVCLLPFAYGFYIFPHVFFRFSWGSIVVWAPQSFLVASVLMVVSVVITFLAHIASVLFPERSKYKRVLPKILLISVLAGLSNMILIVLITSSIDSKVEIQYLVFYYLLALALYLLGRRYVQIAVVGISRELTYELRLKLVNKILGNAFEKIERIDKGRIYTALNDDVETVGASTNTIITVITGIITAIGAFLYLASIAFWATALTVVLIVTIATIYYFVSNSTDRDFSEARDLRNEFIRLTTGMIEGFKEISLRRRKKAAYKKDILRSADQYRNKITVANIRFMNAFVIGESMLIVTLGIVAFSFRRVFPGIESHTIMTFIVTFLYLIGPINGVLSSIPTIMQLKIAWSRIQEFLSEIDTPDTMVLPETKTNCVVTSIQAKGITFIYSSGYDAKGFAIGPIDFEVKPGEIFFIVGGNGSGKTTLAKILLGLYEPHGGEVWINNGPVSKHQLGEYFSAVFSPCYLFEKIYGVNLDPDRIARYLSLLNLEDKLDIADGCYSTINLSGGQRKRLALLQCYLEDSPILLFDEWAADQDPEYREFFYRKLLPEMRDAGKIIIAITHDDHYFDVADRVSKMVDGKLYAYTTEHSPAVR